MATGDINKKFSHSAGSYEVALEAVADNEEVAIVLPANASRPSWDVYDDADPEQAGVKALPAGTGHSATWTPASQTFTYKNETGSAFTGTLVLNFVAG